MCIYVVAIFIHGQHMFTGGSKEYAAIGDEDDDVVFAMLLFNKLIFL